MGFEHLTDSRKASKFMGRAGPGNGKNILSSIVSDHFGDAKKKKWFFFLIDKL
jgi:hypothetical protein